LENFRRSVSHQRGHRRFGPYNAAACRPWQRPNTACSGGAMASGRRSRQSAGASVFSDVLYDQSRRRGVHK